MQQCIETVALLREQVFLLEMLSKLFQLNVDILIIVEVDILVYQCFVETGKLIYWCSSRFKERFKTVSIRSVSISSQIAVPGWKAGTE